MKNTQFKNNIVPWQSKGRWYKFFVESDGSTYSLTTYDIEASISGTSLKIPKSNIIDYVMEMNNTTESVVTVDKSFKLYADGSQGVVLPSVNSVDYITVYVFATLNEG